MLAALLLPSGLIAYLSFFVDAATVFHSAAFHEIAIAFATLITAFLTFLSHRIYKRVGTPFFRFLTLGILGFAAVYAPHGILTRTAQHNAILFLVFGPVSRLTMSAYMLLAILRTARSSSVGRTDVKPVGWWPHLTLFGSIDVAVFLLAGSSMGLSAIHLRITESVTLCVFSLCVLLMRVLNISTPLHWFYPAALLLFAQSSVAFLFARPWNHMWWLAHFVFAAGAFVLGYGLARAYEGIGDIRRRENE